MEESQRYLKEQLITYLGNKRALQPSLHQAVLGVRARFGGRKLRVWDAFSGSGAVSRLLKQHASHLIASDLEPYAVTLGTCFLRSNPHISRACAEWIASLEPPRRFRVGPSEPKLGVVERLYAPADDERIQPGERVFYTRENARRIDYFRAAIEEAPRRLKPFLLGPLLHRASVHANTSGVFKGFYKDRVTGIGQFGGTGRDALSRITASIELEPPVWSLFEPEVEVEEGDALALSRRLSNLDLAYFDPPYNQHPYGSNYFMLNLIHNFEEPTAISEVSGIPSDWTRSDFNVRARSLPLMERLIESIDAPFVLVSFNDEGFIRPDTMDCLLARFGKVQVTELSYPTFRGSRNLRQRELHVKERLLLLERN